MYGDFFDGDVQIEKKKNGNFVCFLGFFGCSEYSRKASKSSKISQKAPLKIRKKWNEFSERSLTITIKYKSKFNWLEN